MNDTSIDLPGLFVVGTDTQVGKTYVVAMIARELVDSGVRVGAYKPTCSGSQKDSEGRQIWDDVDVLAAAIGGGFPPERVCPQRFHAPLAPPVAARLEGKTVDARLMRTGAKWWTVRVDLLLCEGIGGLLCPLTQDETVADLASDLGFPLIVVARLGLGTVNHTLMTVEVASRRGLSLAGIILNQPTPDHDCSAQFNLEEIAARVDTPVLGVVRHNQPHGLQCDGQLIKTDWLSLARPKTNCENGIPKSNIKPEP